MDLSPPLDPRAILYRQVERVLEARAEGKGASESIIGLHVLLAPLKDRDKLYQGAYDRLRDTNGRSNHETFWQWMEAAIRLMDRNKLWVRPGKEPAFGEELLQSV